jgi:hypothetical protein
MSNNQDESSNPLLEKLKTFSESIKSYQPIVFCVECGSTEVIQQAIYRLSCLKCGNSGPWNGYSFAIARDGSAYDAASSFRTLEYFSDYYKDWHMTAIKAIHKFARNLTAHIPRVETKLHDDTDIAKGGDEFESLVEEWNRCKTEVDRLLSKRQE